MASQNITGLKCPGCGGSGISFDPESGKMYCPTCSGDFELKEFIKLSREKNKDEKVSWDKLKGPDIDRSDLHIYSCNSCGAEIIAQGDQATAKCPYCGSNFVLTDKFEGVSMPEGIIPFKMTKQYAEQTMRRYVSEKAGIPQNMFKKEWLDQMQGVYMPCWLFDCDVTGIGVFTQTEHVEKGFVLGVSHSSTSQIREEKETTLTRIATMHIDNIPARAETRLREETVLELYPYNFDEMVDFNPALLTGYKVGLYNVSPEDEKERIEKAVEGPVKKQLRSCITNSGRIKAIADFPQINSGRYGYCLLPVWMCRFTWEGHVFKFCMNGQTGESMIEFSPYVIEEMKAKERGKRMLTLGIGVAALVIFNILFFTSLNNRVADLSYSTIMDMHAIAMAVNALLGLPLLILAIIWFPGFRKFLVASSGRTSPSAALGFDVNSLLKLHEEDSRNIGTSGYVKDFELVVSKDEPYGTRTYELTYDNNKPVWTLVRFTEAKK
ncbi:MAG: hypothetical protein K6C99_08750 [Lachnospiraceae bacterium]|nr:hypothetical protein [Lachnospiraceae bacterium]